MVKAGILARPGERCAVALAGQGSMGTWMSRSARALDDGGLAVRVAPALVTAIVVLAGCSAGQVPPATMAASQSPSQALAQTAAPSAAGTQLSPVTPRTSGHAVIPRYAPNPPPGVTCHMSGPGTANLECGVGYSVDGRPIEAVRQGSANASHLLVVLGQMHGEEWAGPLVVDKIRALPVPAGFQVWTVRTMNPDGGAAGQRYNARGVDLNGNFPARWARTAHSGSRVLSEPESVAIARLLTWLQPDLVISIHGFLSAVDTTGGGLRAARARQFAAMAEVGPARLVACSGPCYGNLTDWYTAISRRGGVAFTLEMPPASLGIRTCLVPGYRGRQEDGGGGHRPGIE